MPRMSRTCRGCIAVWARNGVTAAITAAIAAVLTAVAKAAVTAQAAQRRGTWDILFGLGFAHVDPDILPTRSAIAQPGTGPCSSLSLPCSRTPCRGQRRERRYRASSSVPGHLAEV